MSKDKHLGIRVAEQRYENWGEYVEDHPTIDSVSQLVRAAVEDEIVGDNESEKGDSAAVANVEGQLEEVGESIEELARVVRSIDAQVSTLQDRIDEQGREIRRLRREDVVQNVGTSKGATADIADTLPRGEPHSEAWEEAREWVPDGVEVPIVWSGRVGDIAEQTGTTVQKVERNLTKAGHPVEIKSSEVDGERRYWVDESMAEWAARQQGERV